MAAADDLHAELVAVYTAAAEDVEREMARSIARSGSVTGRQISLMAQIDRILAVLAEDSVPILEAMASEEYNDATALSILEMIENTALDADTIDDGFSLIDRRAVEAAAGASFDNLTKAIRTVRANVSGVVMDTQLTAELNRDVRSELARAIATGETTESLAKRLEGVIAPETLEALGDISDGVRVKIGGRTFALADYADLVARTMRRDAATSATVNRMVANNLDIAEITTHSGVEDSCRVYEGLLVSIRGKSPGFATLASLPNGGAPFHPNCGHVVLPRSADFLEKRELASKKKIKSWALNKTWSAIESIRRTRYGGDAEAMRRAARR